MFGHLPNERHTRWTATNPAVAHVRSGDRLVLEVPEASSGQLSANSTTADLARLDYSRVDAAVGPFAVEGAHPGDGLALHLERIQVGDWGWSGVFREFGLLRDRFEDDLVTWRIDRGVARPRSGFVRPVRIPVRPMLGWLGTAPGKGEHGMIPPQRTGGNMDSRLQAPGAVLLLPVEVEDALLSVGDPHAAMGDGEVCGTGIETPAHVEMWLELVRGGAPRFPRLEVERLPVDSGPAWVTTGIGPDPMAAARDAVEGMIEWLGTCGISPKESYLLTSIVGHLRLSEVVDLPNYVVSLTFPRDLPGLGLSGSTPFKPTRPPRARSRHVGLSE